MPEYEREVKTFVVQYRCDQCQKGDMEPTGIILTTDPPQFPHKCNQCGHETTFSDKKYPYQKMVYREGN